MREILAARATYTVDEIVARLGCVLSTVDRTLAWIPRMWVNEMRD